MSQIAGLRDDQFEEIYNFSSSKSHLGSLFFKWVRKRESLLQKNVVFNASSPNEFTGSASKSSLKNFISNKLGNVSLMLKEV